MRMIKSKLNILLIFLLIYAGSLKSQTFNASVSNTTVGVNEQFQISFTFQGQDINGIRSFNPPNFNNFMVLSGPNQSTSMQIINSSVSASRSYSYYLQPKSMGKFTIGSATLNFNGKTYQTEPITITVVKGSVQPSNKGQAGNQASANISDKEIAENLFIKASADRQRVYLGEQVTVVYKLYTRVSIASQMDVSKLPSYQGFWAEEINTPNNISFSTETINGKMYRVGVLKKVALFPSQTGELSVTPMVLDIPIQLQQKRQSSGNIFDDFFNDPFFNNYKTINYTAKSNSIKIQVMPLPSKDLPKSFNGAVGNFSMNSQISTQNPKTNEPFSLKINLNGNGNIQLLNMPELNLPAGFDKYEPKTSEQINRTGVINGSKTFEYLIIPRNVGKAEIPPIEFSYFNPSNRSYETLKTPAYSLNVTQGSNVGNGNYAGYSKEEIKVLGQDINYIKTGDFSLSKGNDIALFQFGFWLATALPLIFLVGLVTWKRHEDKLAGNLQLLRYQRAEKVARTRFKTAKGFMDENNQASFYAEISQALFGYLEDKLHIPKSEMSLEKAVDSLKAKNTNDDLINNLKNCIEKCEYARFAPSKDGAEQMNEMYKNLSNVVIEIEKSLTSTKDV